VADATPQLNKIKSIKDVDRLKFPCDEKEYEFKMKDLIAKGVIGKFLYQGYTRKCGDGDEAWRTFKKPGKFNNFSPCSCLYVSYQNNSLHFDFSSKFSTFNKKFKFYSFHPPPSTIGKIGGEGTILSMIARQP
jgi:hypothetical protein